MNYPHINPDHATPKQINYLRGLLTKAARAGIVTGFESVLCRSCLDAPLTKRGVSRAIDGVKKQLDPNGTITQQIRNATAARGWGW